MRASNPLLRTVLWLALLGAAVAVIAAVTTAGPDYSQEMAPPTPAPAPLADDAVAAATALLRDAALALGWADAAIGVAPEMPGRAWQAAPAGATGQRLLLAIGDPEGESALLAAYTAQGLPRGLFHGREAIIAHPGDPGCAVGVVAWRCGPYTLAAEGASGQGAEQALAEALYAAAEQHRLCGLPATLVILAETAETPGCNPLRHFVLTSEAVAWYYSLDGYGRVDFAFSFMDADGPDGDRDWRRVGASLEDYRGVEHRFAAAALEQALAGRDLPPVAYVERAIVIHPAMPLLQSAFPLDTMAIKNYGRPYFELEIDGRNGPSRVYVSNLVVLSEDDHLGVWAHELGHTLHSKYPSPEGHYGLTDRYSYKQAELRYGEVGLWDLMGTGNWCGSPDGASPTHMSSYTKEAAGWLRYAEATPGQEYALTALEHQRIGDAALRLDDPLSDDPLCYYIIEARDRDVFYGATETGVVVYSVTYDHAARHAVVNKLNAQLDGPVPAGSAPMGERPTLYGAGQPGSSVAIALAGGLRVALLAESFAPYRATVRVESIEP